MVVSNAYQIQASVMIGVYVVSLVGLFMLALIMATLRGEYEYHHPEHGLKRKKIDYNQQVWTAWLKWFWIVLVFIYLIIIDTQWLSDNGTFGEPFQHTDVQFALIATGFLWAYTLCNVTLRHTENSEHGFYHHNVAKSKTIPIFYWLTFFVGLGALITLLVVVSIYIGENESTTMTTVLKWTALGVVIAVALITGIHTHRAHKVTLRRHDHKRHHRSVCYAHIIALWVYIIGHLLNALEWMIPSLNPVGDGFFSAGQIGWQAMRLSIEWAILLTILFVLIPIIRWVIAHDSWISNFVTRSETVILQKSSDGTTVRKTITQVQVM